MGDWRKMNVKCKKCGEVRRIYRVLYDLRYTDDICHSCYYAGKGIYGGSPTEEDKRKARLEARKRRKL